MDPAIDLLLVGEEQVAVGGRRAERTVLGAEIGAVGLDDRDLVVDGGMQQFQVLDGNLGLALEHGLDVIGAGHRRDIPFLDVADPLRLFQEGRRHQRDVAKGEAAKGAEQRLVGFAVQLVGQLQVMDQLAVADRPEFLEVVARIELVLVKRDLPQDGIEEITARRHVAAGGDAAVVARPLQQGSVGLVFGIEIHRDQDGRAIGHPPFLELLGRKAEHRPGAMHGDGIDAESLAQIRRDLAEHLVDLDDFDWRSRLVQSQPLPQLVDHADGNAGLETAAKVDRSLVRGLVPQHRGNPFAGCHGHGGGSFGLLERCLSISVDTSRRQPTPVDVLSTIIDLLDSEFWILNFLCASVPSPKAFSSGSAGSGSGCRRVCGAAPGCRLDAPAHGNRWRRR